MTVQDLINDLLKFPKEKRIVFWNETLDDNYWNIYISEDEINNTDVVLCPVDNLERKNKKCIMN